MKKISIAIPCYKSEGTIKKVVTEIVNEMKKHKAYDYEVVLVNDGSPDNTYKVISELADNNKKIIAIDLAKNFGQYPALMAAYSQITGDYIVTMDDDGEHNPQDIFLLINKLEEGYDYVCAEFQHYHHSLYKRLGSKFNYWFLCKMMDIPSGTILSSFNVMRRYVLDIILNYNNPKPYVDGMVWAITNKVTSVPIEHGHRYAGESGYNLKNSISLWLNGVTSYSIKPLRLASFCGFVFSIFGFILMIFVVIRRLVSSDVEGWASLFALLLFIGGFIMLFLGLIGEYVGRGYLINNHIPQYVIREKKQKIKNAKSTKN